MSAIAVETFPLGLNLLWVLSGVLCAAVISLVPGLHIYNIAGLIMLLNSQTAVSIPPEGLAFLFLGMISGYALLNTIPSVFLSVPDESTVA